jgi:predicted RNA-binding protein with PUA domain
MMEHDRVADLIRIEEREKLRVEEMKKGAATIREQITERREATLLNQERRDQETKLILKKIAETIEQEKHEKAVKVAAQKKMMIAVNQANMESKELKKLEKQKDLEEDLKVLRYLTEKEKKDEEKDRLAMEKKAEREKELARLRAMQEKVLLF